MTGTAKPVLLSSSNPQIPLGYGDAPVAAYIAAMPGWKRAVGERLDALIVAAVPGVAKAVKWNTPFYGLDGQGWFTAFYCYKTYVSVTFFHGDRMTPVPPKPSKSPGVRYLHIREGDVLDAAQFTDWIRQASLLPGEKL